MVGLLETPMLVLGTGPEVLQLFGDPDPGCDGYLFVPDHIPQGGSHGVSRVIRGL